MNFILGIRNIEAVGDFSYPLKNCSQIIERIEDYEFKQPETLNFNLFDYMITQEVKSEKYDIIIKQIVNRSEKSYEFIKAYIERGINQEIFIQEICHHSDKIWLDVLLDNTISEETQYKYFKLILCYADVPDIVLSDNYKVSEYEKYGVVSWFIVTHRDILQRLKDIPLNKMIQIIEKLSICFSELKIEGVDEELLEYIFANQRYELNHSMLESLFKMKKPECVPDLYRANYKMIRNLGYEPLTKYVNTNIGKYVNTFILGTETNNEDDFESVKDIIDRLYRSDDDKCLLVIDKEPVIWEKLEDCCTDGLQNETFRKDVLKLWNHILEKNRTIPSWENYSKYRDEFGIKPELVNYLNTHMDEFISALDKDIVSDDLIKEILIAENISLHSFNKFIQEFRIKEFTNTLNEFDEKKVKAMIAERYFPFSSERYIELRKVYPDRCIEFICKNKQAFIEIMDMCGLTEDEVVKLLKVDSFSADDKIKILNQIESTEFGEEIALWIRKNNIKIDKVYIETAWNQLSKDNKYELLINHIEVYSKDELAVKFDELGGVYHQLAKRTKHKVSFHDDSAGYNKRLLNYLNKIDYLSSIKEEDKVVDEDEKTHKRKVEHKITGMVKQANN